MTTPRHNTLQEGPLLDSLLLTSELDQAMAALTTFDVGALEALEKRIHLVTLQHLAASRGSLPELLKKRALLEQLLNATAANLKVLVSVLNLEVRMEMR